MVFVFCLRLSHACKLRGKYWGSIGSQHWGERKWLGRCGTGLSLPVGPPYGYQSWV